MMMNTNVQAHPIEKNIDYPKYYVIHELVIPTPEAESGGLPPLILGVKMVRIMLYL